MRVCMCTYLCMRTCVHAPDPKNACIVYHIPGVCVEKQAGKPKPNRAVHSLLSTARPQAVPDRKLGGLGSKLHLVREENAAFVSCSVCQSVYSDRSVCCGV